MMTISPNVKIGNSTLVIPAQTEIQAGDFNPDISLDPCLRRGDNPRPADVRPPLLGGSIAYLRNLTIAALITLLLLADSTQAARYDWEISGGSWDNPANWLRDDVVAPLVPTASDDVFIDYRTANAGAGVTGLARFLTVGVYGDGTLNITGGGTVTAPDAIHLGEYVGSEGTVTVNNGTMASQGGVIFVGVYGDGTLNITNGGTVTAYIAIHLGEYVGSEGTVTVNNGTMASQEGALYVGYEGKGTLNITGGGNVTSKSNIFLGSHGTGEGKVTVGKDSFLTATQGGIFVGGNGVQAQGTGLLAGSGTITVANGAVVIHSTGTLSPGDAAGEIGALTIIGNLHLLDNSTLQIDIGDTGCDIVRVEGAGNSVIIEDGAKLNVVGHGIAGQEYLIIFAGKPQFLDGTLFMDDARFSQEIRDTGGYWITWLMNTSFVDDIAAFGTPNSLRAAVAMDAIYDLGLDSGIADLSKALDGIVDPQELANAFAQLHGEVFASNKGAVLGMQRRFKKLLPSAQHLLWNDRNGIFLGQCDPCGPCGGVPAKWNRWGTFTGDYLDRDNIGQYSGYDLRTFGVTIGMDRKINNRSFVGGAFGYDNAYQKFNAISSYDQIDAFRGMLYGGVRNGNTFADGYAGYTKNYHKTRRDINILNETARSKYDDDMVSLGFDIGRKLYFGNGRVTPSVGLHYIYLDMPSVTETGSSAGLHVAKSHYNSLRLPMGVKFSNDSVGRNGIIWTPEARMFYIRELADDAAWVRTSFAGAGGVSFLAASGSQGRNSARLGVGLNARLNAAMSLRADYDYEVFDHTSVNEFSTTLGVRW